MLVTVLVHGTHRQVGAVGAVGAVGGVLVVETSTRMNYHYHSSSGVVRNVTMLLPPPHYWT